MLPIALPAIVEGNLIFLSVALVSAISLVAIVLLSIGAERLSKILLYLVSFSAGGLLGDAFLHLIPEAAEDGFTLRIASFVLVGLLASFVIEKFVHWHHHGLGHEHAAEAIPPYAFMNLTGDFVHNIVDGLIIAGSYLVSIPLGIATTIAVAFHEIPQEIGDYGVLLHAGVPRRRAILFNFLSALGAFLGAGLALVFSAANDLFLEFLVPFAAGSFLYVAGSDLIPELHKVADGRKSVLQLVFLLAGVGVMAALLLLE